MSRIVRPCAHVSQWVQFDDQVGSIVVSEREEGSGIDRVLN